MATVSKTAEELQKELETVDFSASAGGDNLIVWVQEIESHAGIVELPMLEVHVPIATKKRTRATGAPAKDTIASLIVQTLTEPLSKAVPPGRARPPRTMWPTTRSASRSHHLLPPMAPPPQPQPNPRFTTRPTARTSPPPPPPAPRRS